MKLIKPLFMCLIFVAAITSAMAQTVVTPLSTTTTYPSAAPSNSPSTVNVPLYSKADGALYVDFLDQMTVALAAGSNVIGAVTQSGGPWSFSASSLPLPTGAATDAHLTNVQSAAGTSAATAITVQGSASGVGLPVTGTFWQATQPISAASLPLPSGAALDTSVNGIIVAQGSTTAGQKGGLTLGAVTTAAPSYTSSQSSALSLTTAGALRVDASATTQPVSASTLPLPTGAATDAHLTNVQGTSGSPSTAVLTVQGVSGGTPQPVSGTVTATVTGVSLDAHLTNVQSAAGTTATTAEGIQGVTGGVAVPITASSLPVPTGASLDSHLTNVQGAAGSPTSTAITVQGNASDTALPVSATSLPLPTGASTAAAQTSVESSPGTSTTTVVNVQGSASGIALPVSIASVPTHAVTQSGTWTVGISAGSNSVGTVGINAGTNNIGSINALPTAQTTGGATHFFIHNAGTGSNLISGAHTLYDLTISNTQPSTAAYVTLYDTTSATLGSTTIAAEYYVAGGQTLTVVLAGVGDAYTTGISYGSATAESGSTASASGVEISGSYK